MNKQIIKNNIKELVSGNFFYDTYCKYSDNNENKEVVSALIFNAIMISCQLIENIDNAKALVLDLLENNIYSSDGVYYCSEEWLLSLVSKYTSETYEQLLDRLKHGYAVHFTTPNIMNIIKEEGVFSCTNKMFSKSDEELIQKAQNIQLSNKPNAYNTGEFLSKGFGFGQGISMSAQTVAYWMNHTRESLSFLFGGNVYTRDKIKAFEFVKNAIDTLDENLKQQVIITLNNIWDRLIGDTLSLGAILIDRDSINNKYNWNMYRKIKNGESVSTEDIIEYEKVTYWSYNPPKVEEIRPYNYSFDDLMITENDRVKQDISIEYLEFIEVPSITMLEEYKQNNKNNTI